MRHLNSGCLFLTVRNMTFQSEFKTAEGMALPMVGLGTWGLKGNKCVEAVQTALQTGYRLIDTASFYDNEKEVGEGVRKSGIPREEVVIQTKLYPNQYDHASKAINEALLKLNLDYIDILMLHHPAGNDVEAYRAIEEAIEVGKVRAAAISCYYVRECRDFLPRVDIKPVWIQNEIHPFYQDTKVIQYIQAQGIGVQSWYPFGGRGYAQELFRHPTLLEIARNHSKKVSQVVLRWHLQRGVAVIPGSGDAVHIKENLDIFDFELTESDMRRIAALDRAEKHDWY